MPTYADIKSSIKMASGGATRRTSSAGFTELTTGSNQYAIVSVTESYIVGSATGTLTVGGSTVYALSTATPAPFTIYVGPSTTFGSSLNLTGGSGVNALSYVIFQNT